MTLVIENRDWENWKGPMQVEARGFKSKRVTRVRPGHADLAGVLKYGFDDARDVLERASARETAARVAAGAVGRTLLAAIGVDVHSCVVRIGDITSRSRMATPAWDAVERSPVRCADEAASARMVAAIDAARERGDTLGGTAYVVASHVPAGLGSYVHWDRRLDGLIAQAMCSIPSVKGVELGAAVLAAQSPGSDVHDEPRWDAEQGFHHLTNRQGGLAGGVTDGEPVWALVHFKPISTLLHPLRSVDIGTGAEINAHYERSDICVVPAGAVVAEAMLAWVLAAAAVEKFGGDTLARCDAPWPPTAAPSTGCDDRGAPHRAGRAAGIGEEHHRAARRRAARLGRSSTSTTRSRGASGRSPAAIIAADGEARFATSSSPRSEHALRRPGPLVIACGGGLITPAGGAPAAHRARARWSGSTRRTTVLVERVGDGADRPMLGGSAATGIPRLRSSRAARASGGARSASPR